MTTKNTDTPNIKLTEELNKLKPKVSKKVWEEISQTIKVVSVEGYKLPNDEDYAEMAGRVRKEAEKKVANRKNYASYGNIEAVKLVRAWCSNPKLRIEFDSYFQWFVSCILKTFPDSPAQWFVDNIYLREFSQDDLDRMIRDYEQKQANGKADLPNEKSTKTKQNVVLAKVRKLWNLVRRIPYWIYILVIFFAALLTSLSLLGWLEPIKNWILQLK